jgi:hypothetical protein
MILGEGKQQPSESIGKSLCALLKMDEMLILSSQRDKRW